MKKIFILFFVMININMTVCADDSITRNDFVKKLTENSGLEITNEIFFADNNDVLINTARLHGIVSGIYKNDKVVFEGEKNITKAEAAVILDNYLCPVSATEKLLFVDSCKIPLWACQSVSNMCNMGIFDAEESFFPDSEITFAEAENLIIKAVSYNNKSVCNRTVIKENIFINLK